MRKSRCNNRQTGHPNPGTRGWTSAGKYINKPVNICYIVCNV